MPEALRPAVSAGEKGLRDRNAPQCDAPLVTQAGFGGKERTGKERKGRKGILHGILRKGEQPGKVKAKARRKARAVQT